MSAHAALLRVFGLIPMPITPAMASLIQTWLTFGVPEEIIVATVLDMLVGGDASHRTSNKKQQEADAIARAVSDREYMASALPGALARHEIVLRWALWIKIVARTRTRFGSLTRDQMAEIYRFFCLGEIIDLADIDRALDRLIAPTISIETKQSDPAPGQSGLG